MSLGTEKKVKVSVTRVHQAGRVEPCRLSMVGASWRLPLSLLAFILHNLLKRLVLSRDELLLLSVPVAGDMRIISIINHGCIYTCCSAGTYEGSHP